MPQHFYAPEHHQFRESVRRFVDKEVHPHLAEWDRARGVPRAPWTTAGEHGFLGVMVPEEFGGNGSRDFRYRCIVMDELARVGAAALSAGMSMNEDIVAPYLVKLGTPGQRQRWLPGIATGRTIAGIAMTEPGAGSDLRAMRTAAARLDDGGWLLNGTKTFITNGIEADVVVVAARTGTAAGSERATLSLFLVESGTAGFSRGRKLDKIGMHAQDTAELFFDDVHLPPGSLLGTVDQGFAHLMDNLPIERLAIAYYGLAGATAALGWTIDYTKKRTAFGTRIIDFQNTRFELAELSTELDIGAAYMREQVRDFAAGLLTAESAAKAKWWMTEMQKRAIDRCLQLFGGFGYMNEYPIARAYADARVQTIYGGTTEIMKEIIGRQLASG